MDHIRIVHSLPVEQWNTFVKYHPEGNVFHTPEMFEVFRHTQGHIPELWVALDGSRILALFLPIHISLKRGWFRYFTTRTVVYGSALSQPDAKGDQALRLVLQAYKKASGKHSLFTELRNISPVGERLPLLLNEGFVYKEHLNYLIDLNRSVESVFDGIGKRTRKNIKNGLNKARVLVKEVSSKSELEDCYRLLKMTYEAAHVPLADYSLFDAAFDILLPKKMIRFTLAKVDGQAAAVSIELLYKDTLFGWYGGLDRAYGSYVPNELLMWHILKWGAEYGFKKYDFGGAGKPNEKYGVRDFKAKFGGDLVCYGRNVWIPRPLLFHLSKAGYEIYRQLL